MTKAHDTIPPFPAHLDRRDFGNWLSGFCGRRQTPMAVFTIALRTDDLEVLHLIQSFFRCGQVYYNLNRASFRSPNSNPACRFQVYRFADLHAIIMPHFDRHPLYAKKSREFSIWRRGIELVHAVMKSTAGKRNRWSETDFAEFLTIRAELMRQRQYGSKTDPLPL